MENKEIQVILHNDNKIIPLKVKIFDTIRTIKNELAMNSPTLFIHNNLVLLSAFSFAFYGITEGSHIYSIPAPEKEKISLCSVEKKNSSPALAATTDSNGGKIQKFIQRCTSAKLDGDGFPLSGPQAIDPIFLRESAKLKDRMFQRIEGTIKLHRRFLRRFIQTGNCFSTDDPKKKEQSDEEPDSP